MEKGLKSILRQTHWFLVLKSLAFSLSWYFLGHQNPIIFLCISLLLYFFPRFRTQRLFFIFALMLCVAYLSPAGFWTALVLGVVFYLMLGIKELVFVHRARALQMAAYLLILLLSINYFSRFSSWGGETGERYVFLWGALLAATFFALSAELGNSMKDAVASFSGDQKWMIGAVLGGVIVWELSFAIVFLPIPFLSQAALLFLSEAGMLEIFFLFLSGELTGRKLLTIFTIFFTMAVLILSLAPWGYGRDFSTRRSRVEFAHNGLRVPHILSMYE